MSNKTTRLRPSQGGAFHAPVKPDSALAAGGFVGGADAVAFVKRRELDRRASMTEIERLQEDIDVQGKEIVKLNRLLAERNPNHLGEPPGRERKWSAERDMDAQAEARSADPFPPGTRVIWTSGGNSQGGVVSVSQFGYRTDAQRFVKLDENDRNGGVTVLEMAELWLESPGKILVREYGYTVGHINGTIAAWPDREHEVISVRWPNGDTTKSARHYLCRVDGNGHDLNDDGSPL